MQTHRNAEFVHFCNDNNIDMGYNKLEEIAASGFACLNNGLSEEQNIVLMQSTDIIEIVGLIINGLKNKIGNA